MTGGNWVRNTIPGLRFGMATEAISSPLPSSVHNMILTTAVASQLLCIYLAYKVQNNIILAYNINKYTDRCAFAILEPFPKLNLGFAT